MMKLALSPAALGLLRALAARAGVPRDRILLSDWQTTDWQSLTYLGERHEVHLRLAGPGSREIAARIADGLSDVEFAVPGHIVADISVTGQPEQLGDGSTSLRIEALTIAE